MITDINGNPYVDEKIHAECIDFMNRKNQLIESNLRELLEGMNKTEIAERCQHIIYGGGKFEQWVLDDTIILECEFFKMDGPNTNPRLEIRRFKDA